MTNHLFLNKDFMPSNVDSDYVAKHRASGLAHDVCALVDTARYAVENETSGTPLDQRGIASTLGFVSHLLGDLIDLCETLENTKKGASA